MTLIRENSAANLVQNSLSAKWIGALPYFSASQTSISASSTVHPVWARMVRTTSSLGTLSLSKITVIHRGELSELEEWEFITSGSRTLWLMVSISISKCSKKEEKKY